MTKTSSDAMGTRRRLPWETIAIVAVILGCALTTVDFLWAFLRAPMVAGARLEEPALIGGTVVTTKMLFSQKIFYFHVPVAIVSFAFVIVAAVYAVLFLARRSERYDVRCRLCMQVGLIFIIATMISGDLWTRHDWGVWWVWEPRLTTYFILTLLVIAYFILRAAIDDPERRARFSAVFAIIAAIDAPISFMITRLIPSSIHPVVLRSDSGLSPDMLIPFLCGIFGMALVGFGIYRLRLRIEEQAAEVEQLKREFEQTVA